MPYVRHFRQRKQTEARLQESPPLEAAGAVTKLRP
jgi:hypothetical protein